jgi:hypothetical protein
VESGLSLFLWLPGIALRTHDPTPLGGFTVYLVLKAPDYDRLWTKKCSSSLLKKCFRDIVAGMELKCSATPRDNIWSLCDRRASVV